MRVDLVETKNIGQRTAWTNGNPETFLSHPKREGPGSYPRAYVLFPQKFRNSDYFENVIFRIVSLEPVIKR